MLVQRWAEVKKSSLDFGQPKVYSSTILQSTLLLSWNPRFYEDLVAMTGRQVDPQFRKVVTQLRQAEENRPRSKLVDASDLPQREKNVRAVEESFWHQAASGHANPVKRRRRQTLKRSAEKAAPMGKPHKRYVVSGSQIFENSCLPMGQPFLQSHIKSRIAFPLE